ncbi:MAG: PAS domain S-box protein [Acidobacteria bacterium]|nr:PAS domain S-box protein [Acidobacteriota bacterium]MCA1627144.1 PAS domain S-box protein [Acidobacteriota bacterium]
MSQNAFSRREAPDQPSARPVELHSNLYREIFDHSREAIAIIDPDGYYLQQNGAHFTLLGFPDDDLEGKTLANEFDKETFAEVKRQLAASGEFSGEIVSSTKGGEQRNIDLSIFTMRSGLGEPLCYVCIKRDITRRKQDELALRRSQAELTDFFENASFGLLWFSPEGTILRANQAELELTGYTREEFIGRNIVDIHCDREVIDDILERLRHGQVVRDYEARLRCKDGSLKIVRIDSSAYFEDGKFVHSRCFTRDITDRRRTEHRLALQYAITRIVSRSMDFVEGTHEILETVCEGLGWQVGVLWAVDHQEEVLRCVDVWHSPILDAGDFQSACLTMMFVEGTGLPGRIWETGKPVWLPNLKEDQNFARGPVAEHAGLRSGFGFPILLGEEVIGVIEFFTQEIRKPDVELLETIGSVGRQIGQFQERKRAEEKLAHLLVRERSARADAEKANRLKDEFLATLSHELRTPLNAVIGWSRMLKSGKLDQDSANHAIDVIERNAWAQKQIIEDILDVSRVITGKLQLHLGPVDLVTVVNAALDAVRPAFDAKEIKVETDFQEGLKVIAGDADRLQQVVWNLLSNASKFTPPNGAVGISVTHDGKYAKIQISDTGPGIAPDFLPHVFERFRQADGSTTRTHGGLGLGLAIVRHLVELHGGVIAVENGTVRSGAVFTVKLPMPSGELNFTAPVVVPAFAEHHVTDNDLANLRILVVEDEIDALDLLGIDLREHGAIVTGVPSASEALRWLGLQKFDLIISDIGMADTDGYNLIKQVREQEGDEGEHIPAIALTAYARAQDRIRALAAGYNAHVAKPVQIRELVSVIKCLTGKIG